MKHQFIRQTQQLGLFQGFVVAEEELILACIPKVKLLHLVFDTLKRDVKDLTVYLHHNMLKLNIKKIKEMHIKQQKEK